MNLTLEQLIVLANVPEWFSTKTQIFSGAKDVSPTFTNFVLIHQIMDGLEAARYVQKRTGQYRISPEGVEALKSAHTDLKDINNSISRLIAARE